MLRKSGSYFADWRDATGKRHRKAFATLQEAVDYTEQMRASRPPRKPKFSPATAHTRASRGGVRPRADAQPEHASRARDALSRLRPTAPSTAHRRSRPARRRRVEGGEVRAAHALDVLEVSPPFPPLAGAHRRRAAHHQRRRPAHPPAATAHHHRHRRRAPPAPRRRLSRASVSSCSSAETSAFAIAPPPKSAPRITTRTSARCPSTPRATCTKRSRSAPRSRR